MLIPENGPRIVFFSGGSALKGLSQKLIHYTHNSVHIITPFDSGGSSAKLRDAFAMPAVGDIRNRLMALVDEGAEGSAGIHKLFSYRFPAQAGRDELKQELESMIEGRHLLVSSLSESKVRIVQRHLTVFWQNAPESFDLRGASIGNLLLTAGYLENNRDLTTVINLYSRLAQVKGVVRPVVNKDLHLISELEDGRILVGQHLLSGKEAPAIDSKVKRIYLTENKDNLEEAQVHVSDRIQQLIRSADLICYPMGSFYSSILANFLPQGVGRAISSASCPKVFIPNTGIDPESYGLDLKEQIKILVGYLSKDNPFSIRVSDVCNLVLVDQEYFNDNDSVYENRFYGGELEIAPWSLITSPNHPRIDPETLCHILLSLAEKQVLR